MRAKRKELKALKNSAKGENSLVILTFGRKDLQTAGKHFDTKFPAISRLAIKVPWIARGSADNRFFGADAFDLPAAEEILEQAIEQARFG